MERSSSDPQHQHPSLRSVRRRTLYFSTILFTVGQTSKLMRTLQPTASIRTFQPDMKSYHKVSPTLIDECTQVYDDLTDNRPCQPLNTVIGTM